MQTATVDNSSRELEILTQVMERKIDEGQRNASSILTRIEREASMLDDFVAPLGVNGTAKTLRFEAQRFTRHNGAPEATADVILRMPEQERSFRLHPHAVLQAAQKLNAPAAYVRDLSLGKVWERELAAKILDEHATHSTRQRVLVRSVGTEVRGILSDSYRRLNSGLIFSSFISGVNAEGGMIVNAAADDTRSWIEALIPHPISIPTRRNGQVHTLFGARLSSSDFGDGALSVAFYMIEIRCWNGAAGESLMREIHLGGRIPDSLQLSQRTYELDSKTQASAVRDLISGQFSREGIQRRAIAIQKASEEAVDMDLEFKKLAKVQLSKGEIEETKQLLVKAAPEDGVQGEASKWKLASAITAMARDKSDRRKREIEAIAGSLIGFGA